MTKVLEIDNINKSFKTIKVLKSLCMSVSEGSVYGFLGKNGSGKTTTLRLVTGLARPDSGQIAVCGKNVHFGSSEINASIGFLPDVPAFYDYMKPAEYLFLCGRLYHMNARDIEKKSKELLELVGLSKANRKIKGFSRGMKQRLGIAQALIHSPKLLILDEPTSALDPVGRKDVLDIIGKLRGTTTVIFSTHILSDVERVCDEVGVLSDGNIVLNGKIGELTSKYSTNRINLRFDAALHDIFISELRNQSFITKIDEKQPGNIQLSASDINELHKNIASLMSSLSVPLYHYEADEGSLEDLFMDVIKNNNGAGEINI